MRIDDKVKENKLKIPEDDTAAFDILADEKIMAEELAKKLKEAKGMRNIIAHEYGKVDNKIVFQAVSVELENDVKEFIKQIRKYVK